MSHSSDVREFNRKFGFLNPTEGPRKLTKRKLAERIVHLMEELNEYVMACGCQVKLNDQGEAEVYQILDREQDIAEQADALIDIVYLCIGTAAQMGLPWDSLWMDVHRANMDKVRGIKEGREFVRADVIKPDGWKGPQTMDILKMWGYDEDLPCIDDPINTGED